MSLSSDQRKALYLAGAGAAVLAFALAPSGSLLEPLRRLGLPAFHPDSSLSLDQFVQRQSRISLNNLLANVHPKGTAPGCVVASPSKYKPDYWYQWTRDSALVLRAVLRRWEEGDQDMLPLLHDFVDATKDMQHRDTPSGGYRTGGLGEVKFEVDRRPFTGNWGRPQHDGPALRASILIAFARHYARVDPPAARDYVAKNLYDGKDLTETAVKADLDHVAEYWNAQGFDLWEEINARHFYTLLVSLRAMTDGAALAKELSDLKSAEKYSKVAKLIETELERYWDAEKGYILASLDEVNPGSSAKTSWLDTANVLAVIHAGHSGGQWTVTSDKVLATHAKVVDSMRPYFYPLNKRYEGQFACAVGRYPEDIYDGVGTSKAHPWFLCCLAHAELLYRAATTLEQSTIEITPISRPFYEGLELKGQTFAPLPESLKPASEAHAAIIRSMRTRADDFVNIVRDHKGCDGSLSEQFSRIDGRPEGARHLTWSNAAFLSMRDARDGKEMF